MGMCSYHVIQCTSPVTISSDAPFCLLYLTSRLSEPSRQVSPFRLVIYILSSEFFLESLAKLTLRICTFFLCRLGSKFGGGGPAGASEANVDRRERLRQLALGVIDLAKVRVRFSSRERKDPSSLSLEFDHLS